MNTYNDNELLILWHRNCDNRPLTEGELTALREWDKLDFVIEHEKLMAYKWFTDMPDREYNDAAKAAIRFEPRDNEFEDFRTKCEYEYVPLQGPCSRQREIDIDAKHRRILRRVEIFVVCVLGWVGVSLIVSVL